MITSSTSPGSTLARASDSLMTAAPRSWAGTLANAPLKEPTAVRAALAITTDGVDMAFPIFVDVEA